jgi:hypothetical protein
LGGGHGLTLMKKLKMQFNLTGREVSIAQYSSAFQRYGQALKKTKMKTLIITLFLILFVLCGKCQLIDTKFLSGIYTESKDNTSCYIKETYKTESGFKILLFDNPKYPNNKNKLKTQISECNYKSLNPMIEDGYYKDDYLSGQFKNGEMIDVWYKYSNKIIIDTLDYSFQVTSHRYNNNNINKNTNQIVVFSNEIYQSMYNIFLNKFVYPPKSKYSNIQGSSNAEITTNSNGDVTQVYIIKSISSDIDKEIIRVILKYFPKVKDWKGTLPFKLTLY